MTDRSHSLGEFPLRRAESRALRVAQETAARVPAYARFLRLAGYDARCLRSYADFCRLPVIDKPSYLQRYPLDQRCRGGELSDVPITTLSSGSTGIPTLWPRTAEQDEIICAGFSALLQEHFRIQERWTLFIVTLAMGSWVAGTLMAALGQRIFSQPGIRGTVVTPGLSQDDALRFVEQLSTCYDQTLIIGYPATLISLLETGEQRGISWLALNTGLLTGGEYVSEGQREHILQCIGKNPEQLEGFVVLFASSEVAGALGYETPACLLLRRLCARTPALAQALFGSSVLPTLVQYNPLNYFLQVENDEILLTTRGAVPLVRYNTHDRGDLLTPAEVLARCRAHGYDLCAELRRRGFGHGAFRPLPFLYVHGRTDAVIVHGANVYVEHVADVLAQSGLRQSTTSRFQLGAVTDPDGAARLEVTIESRADVQPTEALRERYHDAILTGLQRRNSEFRNAYTAAQGRLTVAVTLVPFGTFAVTSSKHRYIVHDPETPSRPAAERRRPDSSDGSEPGSQR